MGAIGLVIFDCDGVLVDSEPLAMRVLLDAIAEQGIALTPDDAYRDYLGRSLASISASLNDSHGQPLSPAALESMRHDLYALYRRELRPTPHVADVLEHLKIPFCVASSSSIERIRLSLEVTGLLGRLDPHIFSASMVEHGKPRPDLFLHAASTMGVSPERCLVIEDSPAGIRAAKAAGMRVFAYLGGGHMRGGNVPADITHLEPDARMEDMRSLPGLIALHETRAANGRPRLVAAVDAGTASARAGIIDASGAMLGRAEVPYTIRRPDAAIAEHSSEEIWDAACLAVREAVTFAGVRPEEVAGIAFDATCSLVVRDAEGRPVGISTTGGDKWDTIAWMDHRAMAETAEANASGHPALDYVGGAFSPEMQVPKLMWLKRHLPAAWARAGLMFDLSDFLSWKATGQTARSVCTLACKWTYLPAGAGWQHDFLAAMGLDDVLERAGLPEQATPIGTDLGPLSPEAAAQLGLTPACRVGMGLVDAHAGALGSAGPEAAASVQPHRHLTLVGGTSSCVMALSDDERHVHAAWGPFRDAVLPGSWLNEAGQSASGALLDYVISQFGRCEPTSDQHTAILLRVAELRASEGQAFAARLHLLPDFHGNRSPLGDPQALGVISGLSLDGGFDALCRLYYRAAVAIALQLRHILEALAAHGYVTDRLHVAGGHLHNSLLMELYADATGATLVEPQTPDSTLLGTGMAASVAAGLHADLRTAAIAMRPRQKEHAPDPERRAALERDYIIYRELLNQRAVIEKLSTDRR